MARRAIELEAKNREGAVPLADVAFLAHAYIEARTAIAQQREHDERKRAELTSLLSRVDAVLEAMPEELEAAP
jgi:hypothetical protein